MDKIAADFSYLKHIQSCLSKKCYAQNMGPFTRVHRFHALEEIYFVQLILVLWCVWLLRSKNHRKEHRLKSGCYDVSCA